MKRVGEALYVHKSAVGDLPADHARLAAWGRAKLPKGWKWDVVRTRPPKHEVMFGRTTSWDTDPHPALVESILVRGDSREIKRTDHGDNPPIYHRKDAFVRRDDPRRARFAALTRAEEEAGLLGRNDIGRKDQWEALLRNRALAIVDHQLTGRGSMSRRGSAGVVLDLDSLFEPEEQPSSQQDLLASLFGPQKPKKKPKAKTKGFLGDAAEFLGLSREPFRRTAAVQALPAQMKGRGKTDPADAWKALRRRWNPRGRPVGWLSPQGRDALWGFAPDLRWYDAIILNSSGGKDSMVMMDVVLEKARQQGVLDRVLMVHCDLGEVEWEGTRELVEEHARKRRIPLEVVRKPAGKYGELLLEHVLLKGRWPNMANRFCTSEHKTTQVQKVMTRLTSHLSGIARGNLPELIGRRVRILNVLGMRAEEGGESGRRAKMPPFEEEMKKGGSNPTRRVVHRWLPIHGWTDEEVWDHVYKSGLRWHPAYDLGMTRLSCRFCMLAGREDLVLSALANPELAAKYAKVEKQIGQPFQDKVPIRTLVRAAEEARRRGASPKDPRKAARLVRQVLLETGWRPKPGKRKGGRPQLGFWQR